MTSRGLLRLLVRRWYLVILGLSLTLAVLWPVTHRPGVYWTQVNVVILPPTYEYFPNKLEDPQYSLAALAGVIVSDYNGQHMPLLMGSADTTLYGEGRSTGAEVRIPNMGNQWKPAYPNATIDVQVVDANAQVVTDQVDSIVGELKVLLANRQEQLGVPQSLRASIITSPTQPSVYYITGSRTRALGAGALVGLGLSVTGVYWFERLVTWRRARSNQIQPSIASRRRPATSPSVTYPASGTPLSRSPERGPTAMTASVPE